MLSTIKRVVNTMARHYSSPILVCVLAIVASWIYSKQSSLGGSGCAHNNGDCEFGEGKLDQYFTVLRNAMSQRRSQQGISTAMLLAVGYYYRSQLTILVDMVGLAPMFKYLCYRQSAALSVDNIAETDDEMPGLVPCETASTTTPVQHHDYPYVDLNRSPRIEFKNPDRILEDEAYARVHQQLPSRWLMFDPVLGLVSKDVYDQVNGLAPKEQQSDQASCGARNKDTPRNLPPVRNSTRRVREPSFEVMHYGKNTGVSDHGLLDVEKCGSDGAVGAKKSEAGGLGCGEEGCEGVAGGDDGVEEGCKGVAGGDDGVEEGCKGVTGNGDMIARHQENCDQRSTPSRGWANCDYVQDQQG